MRPVEVIYPTQCLACVKQFSVFRSAGHPDDGVKYECGLMTEKMKTGTEHVPCDHRSVLRVQAVPECKECIVTAPACGGCAPVIDAEIHNAYLKGRQLV